MGYLHIDNLYKNTEILMFKECYALEKIHGTSAHIRYEKKFLQEGKSNKNRQQTNTKKLRHRSSKNRLNNTKSNS